jgi:hypothetical protein
LNPAVQKVGAFALVGVVGLLTGYGYGRFSAPDRSVRTDQSTELQALRLQLQTLQQENTNLKRHTVTRVEYSPTTGKPLVKTEDTHVDLTKDLTTDVKASTEVHSAKLVDQLADAGARAPELEGDGARRLRPRCPVPGVRRQDRAAHPWSVVAGRLGDHVGQAVTNARRFSSRLEF